MQIAEDKVVAFHYTLTNDSGEVLDSSAGGDPLTYLHGRSQIIPGLEQALDGHQAGEKMQVSLAAEDAYGPRDEALVQVMPRSAFQGVGTIEPGMQFEARERGGGHVQLTVTQVEGDQITVDANHPLAGERLNFDVEIVDVRDASADELSHGHVHGPGGHH